MNHGAADSHFTSYYYFSFHFLTNDVRDLPLFYGMFDANYTAPCLMHVLTLRSHCFCLFDLTLLEEAGIVEF